MNQPIDLIDKILSSNSILTILANVWVFCRAHLPELRSTLNQRADLIDLNCQLRLRLYETIKSNCLSEAPLILSSSALIRDHLVAKDDKELLARCEALLRALSKYVAEKLPGVGRGQYATIVSTLDGASNELLIMRRSTNQIVESGTKPPRSVEQVSSMLKSSHPELDISWGTVDGCSIEPRLMPFATLHLFRNRVERGDFRIAISCLSRDVQQKGLQPGAVPKQGPVPFLITSGGNDEGAQIDRLKKVLEQCRDHGVSILVLPELRVPPALLDVIQSHLKNQSWEDLIEGRGLVLVVAGSWHLQIGEEWRNRTHVLDHRGEVVMTHDKLAEFRVTPQNVSDNSRLKELLGINDNGGFEQISVGRTLEFFDCALGRLSVAICVGFFHDPIRTLLAATGANVFLVPAMSPDVGPLQERARDLVRLQYAATFVANCGTMGQEHGKFTPKTASFYLLPMASGLPVTMTDDSDYILLYEFARSATGKT